MVRLSRWMPQSIPAPKRATEKMRIVVASTLTCGLNDTLKLALMYSGNVLTEPALNSVMMKSSIDRANASSAAARMRGAATGT